jgi:prevent-host-death family protein
VAEVGVHEAKTKLSQLLRRVQAGEEVTILRGGTPVARLVPVKPAKRQLGQDVGRFVVPDDFDAPLDDETLEAFES